MSDDDAWAALLHDNAPNAPTQASTFTTVVLAAGMSSRRESAHKLLLPVGGPCPATQRGMRGRRNKLDSGIYD